MLNESKQTWRMVFKDIFASSDEVPPAGDSSVSSVWDDDSSDPVVVDSFVSSAWDDGSFEFHLNDMSADLPAANEAGERVGGVSPWMEMASADLPAADQADEEWQAACAIGADHHAVALTEAEAVTLWQSICQRIAQRGTATEVTHAVRQNRFKPASWPLALAATLLVGMALPTFGWFSYRQIVGSVGMPSALNHHASGAGPPAAAPVEPIATGEPPARAVVVRRASKAPSAMEKNEPLGLLMATYKSDSHRSSVSAELVTARYQGSGWR
ncbi:MAG: hypothetical protein RMM98_10350 [Acidobacteriota bacterium]|nr:hypothetical protein [Blastocatellia bacterium]MDW8240006.1 hypothetical protein [Acidobacteriota bacterium]